VALMLFKAAYKIVWPALLELSDAAAEKTVQRQILTMARSVPGVRDVHGLRTRRMGPGYQVDLHVLVDRQLSVETGHGICAEVKHLLVNDGPHIIDVLVHLEPYPTSP